MTDERENRIRENMLSGGDLYFNVGGASYHTERKQDNGQRYNETNPGLGVMYQWSDGDVNSGVLAGQYKNSYDRDTYYLAGQKTRRLVGDDELHLDAGFRSGFLTGYGNGTSFAFMPMVTLGNKSGALNLMYAPKTSDKGSEAIMIDGQIKLK